MSILEKYKEGSYKINIKLSTDDNSLQHELVINRRLVAEFLMDTNNRIVRNDYCDSEDLRFLLLKVIDKYEKLYYTGEELAILEFGVNEIPLSGLCTEILITKESLLDVKSFRYNESKAINKDVYIG